jgi:DNA recombination protein RmuC
MTLLLAILLGLVAIAALLLALAWLHGRSDLALCRAELSRGRERLEESERSRAEERRRADELASRLDAERQKLSQAAVEAASLRAGRDAARDELERHRAGEAERNALVRAEIGGLSERIFEAKTGKFRELGTAAIAELVTPMREDLERLRAALVESETRDAVREQSLREALERVSGANARLGAQADELARALSSDNKLVGDFGEEILERLLEHSGLVKGVNWVEQGIDLDLRGEDGGRLMPDVVVFLPENRCLVVDSKMSLKSWARAQCDDPDERASALEAFRRSVRAHVDDLASKSYAQALQATGRGALDFKFLFIPVESAFHACLRQDRELYRYAFDRRIVLVSPTTLLAVLTTVHHTWKQFEIGRNAEAIRDRAARLLDKLQDFFASMEKVGEALGKAQESFDTARKRLATGNGNLVSQARRLKELRVDSVKSIPPGLEELAGGEEP